MNNFFIHVIENQSGFGVTCAEDLRRRRGEHVGVPAQSSPKIGGQRTKIKIAIPSMKLFEVTLL